MEENRGMNGIAGEISMIEYIAVGSYTDQSDSKGIYLFSLDGESGKLALCDTAEESVNPSYLAYCEKNGCLYAANEMPDGAAISSYRVRWEEGKLISLGAVSARGAGMCHIAAHSGGRFLSAAHYLSGNAVTHAILEDGRAAEGVSDFQHRGKGVNRDRQEHEHVHSTTFSPDERYIYAADLGTDEVVCYAVIGQDGMLCPHPEGTVRVPGGEGPRHFLFHPNGRYAYLITEMGNHIFVYDFEKVQGELTEKQRVDTLPAGFKGYDIAADLCMTANGAFLYASNRGDNSIAAFKVCPDTGRLSLIGHTKAGGDWPRSICLASKDRYLLCANQESGNVAVFLRDQKTGKLVKQTDSVSVPKAVCVKEIVKKQSQ